MAIMKFSDWVLARESSAFTRLRHAAALGLMPPIPDASINSRSTATPFEQESLKGKGKKKRKRKKKVDSGPMNRTIDAFVKAAEDLKKDMESLEKSKKLKDTTSTKKLNKKEDKKDEEESGEDKEKKDEDQAGESK
jgi:hypothetical protein